jgi:regulator of sigma E protease
MENLVMIGQLLLGLSILIGLHEMGHMLAAKAFGMRVEKFSIGFPPKLFGFKYKETEYSLGALPLGGFVKISGMIDESLDTEQMQSEPQPWEFRAKPAWQRLIVMIAGIVVNVVLGLIIFIGLTYQNGDTYIPREEGLKNGIYAMEYGQQVGLRTGDKILKINGKEYERFSEVMGADVLLADKSYYTIERDGEIMDIQLPPDLLELVVDKETAPRYVMPRTPFVVEEVVEGSNAEKAGLQPGDRIVAVNGKEITFFDEFKEELDAKAGQEITMEVMRDGEIAQRPEAVTTSGDRVQLSAQVDEDGTLGFLPRTLINFKEEKYGFSEAVSKGTSKAFESVWLNIRGFGKIFSGDVNVSKSVKGPIGIREIYGGTWDWTRFWGITGLLSMWLAFVNFLPIPALDGGHVTFLTYEMISGSAPSDRFMEVAQKAGMAFILLIMGLVIFNDIFNLFF